MSDSSGTRTNAGLMARRAAALPRGVGQAHPLFAARAENAEIWDVEGKRWIDFCSGIAVVNTGHRHPRVMAAARAQLENFTHTCFQVMAYESYVELCERLNVDPLEFDGRHDSIFQQYDRAGGAFMQYVHDYGVFHTLPYDMMRAEWARHYPAVSERGWPQRG